MGPVWTIAISSFREAIRGRILYTLLLFSILMMISSHVVEALVISQKGKIVKDMGLGAISIFGLLISITIGASVFFREVEKRSAYLLLSKPVSRWQVLTGKYFGALLTLFVTIVLMGIILELNTAGVKGKFDPYLPVGISFIFVELSILTVFALFFSTFSAPISSGALTCMLYVLGHLVGPAREALSMQSSGFGRLFDGLHWVVPDLGRFDLKAEVIYRTLPTIQSLIILVVYAGIYVCVGLFLSWVVVRRKDIR